MHSVCTVGSNAGGDWFDWLGSGLDEPSAIELCYSQILVVEEGLHASYSVGFSLGLGLDYDLGRLAFR